MENYCVHANDATSEVNNWVLFTTEQPVTSEGAIEAPENSVLPEINESTLSTVGEDNSTIEDDENLKTLLKEFRLECIFENLKAAQITYRCLKYIQKEDLKEAVPHLGLRIEFREKLFAWRKNKFGVDDETISVPSKVNDWFKACIDSHGKSSCLSSTNASLCTRLFSKDITALLTRITKGINILEYYKENNTLTSVLRDEVINIIVEEIVLNGITLKANDFAPLFNEICSLFPTERTAEDYYFIPRKGRNNPGGKLYVKYKNQRSKKRILGGSISENVQSSSKQQVESEETNEKDVEIDESIALGLKTSLSRGNADWTEICDMWKKTYPIRQRDLKSMKTNEFLQSWPKLLDSRAQKEFYSILIQENGIQFENCELLKQVYFKGTFYKKFQLLSN